MGFLVEVGVQMRKSVTTSLGTCCRLLFHHPLFMAFLLFLTFLHRFFPFVFSLLVTASPILVCSVVLLGTLLIFGQTNLPKTEREMKITHDSGDAVFSQRERTFSIDKFLGKSVDEASCSRDSSDPEGLIGYVPLMDETCDYSESSKRDFDSEELENQRVIHKKKLGNGDMKRTRNVEKAASLKGDHSESSQGAGGGDDEASGSGSDPPESWSPDASIEDILPILDELHPLLDFDVSLLAPMTTDDAVGYDRSNGGSNDSDDDDDDDDDTDDTDIQGRGVKEPMIDDKDGRKEDASKSAIKWTDDDQMNVRDLGNSELEKNRCLENHITRRRESKSYSLAAEKNLIDLDTSENPFNATQISTRNHNPFDVSKDVYDDMPILGSAPSTYVPRRNPFDLQYELNEANPELKGDLVRKESVSFVPNNTIFCRHQSFRPPRVEDAGQEWQDLQWRPVFVPDQLSSGGTSYSSFGRLPSDSKLSSIPNTESLSSEEDLDDERMFSARIKEEEEISNIYQASDLVGHGRHSSEDLEPLVMGQPEKEDAKYDEPELKFSQVENGKASLSGTVEFVIPVEPITNAIYLKPEAFDIKNSNSSSLSSSSEADEKSSDLRNDGSKIFEPFETELQTSSGLVDENQHEGPVFDPSPPGSARVHSFDSISSDTQPEFGDVSSKDKMPAQEPLTILSESKEDSSIKDLNAVGVQGHAVDSTKEIASSNTGTSINETVTTPDSPKQFTEANVDEQKQPSNSKDKSSKVETSTEDSTKENASSNRETGVKEPVATSGFLKEVSQTGLPVTPPNSPMKISEFGVEEVVTTNSPKEVSKANDREVPKPSEFGTNAMGSTKEIKSTNIGSAVQEFVTTQDAFKKVSENNVGEVLKDESTDVGNNTLGSTSNKDIALSDTGSGVQQTAEAPVEQVSETDVSKQPNSSKDIALSNKGSGVQETNTSVKQISKSDASESAKPTTDEFRKLATNDVVRSTISLQETVTGLPKHVSKGDLRLPESSNSKDGSNEVEINAVGSGEKSASNTLGTGVPETVSTRRPVKELPIASDLKDEHKEIETNAVSSTEEDASKNAEDGSQGVTNPVDSTKSVQDTNVSDVLKTSNAKDGSKVVRTNGEDSTEKLASCNTDGTVQEGVSTHTTKRVPAGNVSEVAPSYNYDRSAEVGTNALGSTKSVEETAATLKPVSEGNSNELPKSSDLNDGLTKVLNTVPIQQASEGNDGEILKPSKDGTTEVGTNIPDSDKKLALSNTGASVQKSISTQTENKVAEDSVAELPKPSNLKDELPNVEVDTVGSTKDIPSESGVEKSITTSEGDAAELPRSSNKEGHAGEVEKPSISEESNAGELPKPTIQKESDAIESQKPPESKGWLWW